MQFQQRDGVRRHALTATIILGSLLGALGGARSADLTVTNYGVTGTTLPWAVALEKGFFKQNGVQIDGIQGTSGGGTSVRIMMANPLPVAQVSTAAAVAAALSGIDVIMIYSPVNNMGDVAWLTPAGSKFKSMADLKGAKVGYTNPRSTTEILLRMSLQGAGLTKDVEIITTGSVATGFTVMDQGVIAAAPTDEPLLSPPGKYRTLFMANEYVPTITWDVGITTREFATKNPELVRGIVKSFRQGVDFIYANLDEAAKIHSKVFEIKPEISHQILPKLAQSNYWSRGKFNPDALQAMVKGMELVGALDKPIDVLKLVDSSYLPEDLR